MRCIRSRYEDILFARFQSGRDAADCRVGSVVVVSPEPFGRLVLSLLYGFKDVLVQPSGCKIVIPVMI